MNTDKLRTLNAERHCPKIELSEVIREEIIARTSVKLMNTAKCRTLNAERLYPKIELSEFIREEIVARTSVKRYAYEYS
jgi:hypothetical protein